MQGASLTSARVEMARDHESRSPIRRMEPNAVCEVMSWFVGRDKIHSCCCLHYMQPKGAA